VVQALANGEAAAPAWGVLARETEAGILKFRPHLLRRVAERIRKADRATAEKLERSGWKALKAAIQKFPVLLSPAMDGNTVLPVLEVACLVRSHDPAVSIALDLIAAQDFPVFALTAWWRELLLGMENVRRLTGRPHPKDSLTNSVAQLSAIAKELSPKAREVLTQVLEDYKRGTLSAVPAVVTPDKPAPPSPSARPTPHGNTGSTASKASTDDLEKLTGQCIEALFIGDSDHPCWETLATRVRTSTGTAGGEQHLWIALLQAVRHCDPHVQVQLENGGWDTLKPVLKDYPDLMRPSRTKGGAHAGQSYLPVCDLATELRPETTKLVVAQDLVLLDTSAPYLKDEEWWRGLFRGLDEQGATSLARVLEGKLKMNPGAKEAMHKARSRRA
jgi:hypothetical protein